MSRELAMNRGIGRRVVKTAAVALVAVAALTACSSAPEPGVQDGQTVVDAEHTGDFLAELGLEGLDAKQAIDKLDRLPTEQRPSEFTAQVQPSQLVLTHQSGRTAGLPMPEDQFYLSAAPYVNQTHSCHFHSLTTCLGELYGEEVEVKASNAETGEVLVNKSMETFDNGFIGLWVPRGITVDLEFAYEGKTAKSTVSTAGTTNATCLTQLRLV